MFRLSAVAGVCDWKVNFLRAMTYCSEDFSGFLSSKDPKN